MSSVIIFDDDTIWGMDVDDTPALYKQILSVNPELRTDQREDSLDFDEIIELCLGLSDNGIPSTQKDDDLPKKFLNSEEDATLLPNLNSDVFSSRYDKSVHFSQFGFLNVHTSLSKYNHGFEKIEQQQNQQCTPFCDSTTEVSFLNSTGKTLTTLHDDVIKNGAVHSLTDRVADNVTSELCEKLLEDHVSWDQSNETTSIIVDLDHPSKMDSNPLCEYDQEILEQAGENQISSSYSSLSIGSNNSHNQNQNNQNQRNNQMNQNNKLGITISNSNTITTNHNLRINDSSNNNPTTTTTTTSTSTSITNNLNDNNHFDEKNGLITKEMLRNEVEKLYQEFKSRSTTPSHHGQDLSTSVFNWQGIQVSPSDSTQVSKKSRQIEITGINKKSKRKRNNKSSIRLETSEAFINSILHEAIAEEDKKSRRRKGSGPEDNHLPIHPRISPRFRYPPFATMMVAAPPTSTCPVQPKTTVRKKQVRSSKGCQDSKKEKAIEKKIIQTIKQTSKEKKKRKPNPLNSRKEICDGRSPFMGKRKRSDIIKEKVEETTNVYYQSHPDHKIAILAHAAQIRQKRRNKNEIAKGKKPPKKISEKNNTTIEQLTANAISEIQSKMGELPNQLGTLPNQLGTLPSQMGKKVGEDEKVEGGGKEKTKMVEKQPQVEENTSKPCRSLCATSEREIQISSAGPTNSSLIQRVAFQPMYYPVPSYKGSKNIQQPHPMSPPAPPLPLPGPMQIPVTPISMPLRYICVSLSNLVCRLPLTTTDLTSSKPLSSSQINTSQPFSYSSMDTQLPIQDTLLPNQSPSLPIQDKVMTTTPNTVSMKSNTT